MDLTKCKKASIYDLEHQFLCDAVVTDAGEDSVTLLYDNPTADLLRSEVHVTFYERTLGMITYLCRLSNYQEYLSAPDCRVSTTNCHLEKEISVIQRRNDLKIHVHLETTITFKNKEDVILNAAIVILDISAGGIFFTCRYQFQPGQEFTFSFKQTSTPLVLKARVLRLQAPHDYNPKFPESPDTFGYGCRFVDLSPYSESLIRNFVYRKDLQLQRQV